MSTNKPNRCRKQSLGLWLKATFIDYPLGVFLPWHRNWSLLSLRPGHLISKTGQVSKQQTIFYKVFFYLEAHPLVKFQENLKISQCNLASTIKKTLHGGFSDSLCSYWLLVRRAKAGISLETTCTPGNMEVLRSAGSMGGTGKHDRENSRNLASDPHSTAHIRRYNTRLRWQPSLTKLG